MGNSCEGGGECLQPVDRDSMRRRSLSDPAENMTLKNMIQIKKGRLIDEYILNEQVGEGSYGNVYRVTHKVSRVVRAAKRIEKRKKSIQAL